MWDTSNFDPTNNTARVVWNTGKVDTFSFSQVISNPPDPVAVAAFGAAANAALTTFLLQYSANQATANSAASVADTILTQVNG